jgi:uroporphyrinogen decarboxylase
VELSFKVFEHAAALIGRTPWDVSRDADLLFQAQAAAFRLYRHQPLIAAIDHYNLAPEAYGAVVARTDGHGVPAITKPLLATTDGLLHLRPFDASRDGRIPMILDVASRLAREFPETEVAVPVDGPFSIASALVGFDRLLCDVVEEPDRVQSALAHLIEGQATLAEQARALGLEVAFAESAAGPPLLSPGLFRRVELPVLQTLLARMGRIMGHPIACLMGGDTVRILDELLETGSPYLVCPHETDQVAFVKRLWDRPEIRVRINLHAGIIARGSWDELRAEADRVLAFARGRPNTLLGAGVLPYETRAENIFRLRDYIGLNPPQS